MSPQEKKLLAGLQEQLEILKAQPTEEGFYKLAHDLEAYRDFVRDHLETVEESPILDLQNIAHDLARKAFERQIIGERLLCDIGNLACSLIVVSTPIMF